MMLLAGVTLNCHYDGIDTRPRMQPFVGPFSYDTEYEIIYGLKDDTLRIRVKAWRMPNEDGYHPLTLQQKLAIMGYSNLLKWN